MDKVQGSQLRGVLKLAGGMALGLGLLYAAFMTIRDYGMNPGAGPNLGIVFAVNFLYCAVPLFVVLFPVIGVITVLQHKSGAQR